MAARAVAKRIKVAAEKLVACGLKKGRSPFDTLENDAKGEDKEELKQDIEYSNNVFKKHPRFVKQFKGAAKKFLLGHDVNDPPVPRQACNVGTTPAWLQLKCLRGNKSDLSPSFWAQPDAAATKRLWFLGLGGSGVKVPATQMPLSKFVARAEDQHNDMGGRLNLMSVDVGIKWGTNIGFSSGDWGWFCA